MRKYILAAIVAGSFAAPAMAQDNGSAPFTGVRVEGLLGWDRPQSNGTHADGILYGGGVGYDFQAGRAVLGVEGEATGSTAKDCIASFSVTGDRLCTRSGRDLYVGGRVGALVAPSTLLYAKAGYTNGRVRATYDVGGTTTRSGQNLDGFRVGGGVEQAVGARSFVKVEYRYSNYEQNVDRHQVVAGFGFRF
jgi:outer membrane immunogenic protein